MRALVYTGTETLEMRDVAAPEPAEGESVVAVDLCGICGSDMHAWHGHDARRVPPLVLGHEAVGVAETGPHAGRRVAINPLMSCGVCPACLSGRRHLCPHRELIGMRVPGAFAERVRVRDRNLTVLPDALPFQRAVLAEPLACAVHAVRLGLARLGEPAATLSAVVLGGGAIGLLSALVLKVEGIGQLAVAETNAPRREALDALLGGGVYDPIAAPGADGSADLVIDAVGSGPTRAAASSLVRPGGAIVHVGLQNSGEGLDTRRITLQEIAFIGSYCYGEDDFAAALSLLEEGAIDGAAWSETRPLEAGAASFTDIDRGRAPAKIVLSMR
ncbi:MAG: alcohol dehydrogenase catalytic domain-containing protein [Pseudomonadota bacterium]